MIKTLVEDLLQLKSTDKSVGRNHGRAHTRQVLLRSDAEHLQEHDVANLLLAMNNSKIDKAFDSVKVIEHFGSLYRLLTAKGSDLGKFGVGQDTIDVFDLVHEASRRLASVETRVRILLSDTNALALHLGVGTTLVGSNHLVALFLNSRNHLLEEVSFSLNQNLSDVSLKIGKYMLSTNATSLLLATIHKGASPLPTGRDNEITDRMKKMATVLAFKLLEHVVFCPAGGHYSFKLSSDVGRSKEWPDKLTLPALIKQFEVRGVGGPVISINGFAEDRFSTLFIKTALQETPVKQSPKRGLRKSHKLTTLSDAELLDILFNAASRSNSALAARMIKLHVSFASILNLKASQLVAMRGVRPELAVAIKVIHTAAIRLFHAAVIDQPRLVGHADLTRYLKASLSRERVEHFRVLFLDANGRLRADELQSRGTVNYIEVYPREIVHRALDLGSKILILVHNHPSGDPTPSQTDIDMTKQVEDAAFMLELDIGDHIIIGNGTSFSFRKQGLLRPIAHVSMFDANYGNDLADY